MLLECRHFLDLGDNVLARRCLLTESCQTGLDRISLLGQNLLVPLAISLASCAEAATRRFGSRRQFRFARHVYDV
jgi:hypothetical protein